MSAPAFPQRYGIVLPAAVAVLTFLAFLPVLLTYAVATLVLRKNPLEVVGLLAGNLNTTTILINANDVLKTEIPNLSFAFAYPVGLLLALVSTEAAWLLLPLVR